LKNQEGYLRVAAKPKRRKMMKKRMFMSVLAISMLLLAGCGQTAEPAGENLPKITVSYDGPFIYNADMFADVGMEKGFFKDEGLDVEWRLPPSFADVLKFVAAREVDIGIGYSIDPIIGHIQGMPVTVIASVYPRDWGGIMYFKDTGWQTPADIKGSTVAIYALPQTELHFKAFLAHAGLTENDVTKVSAGDYSVPLMVAGKVQAADAAAGMEDLETQLATGREVGNWLYCDNGVPPFYGFLVLANSDFLKETPPEVTTAFLRALFKSINYTAEHPGEAVDIVSKRHPEIDSGFVYAGWKMFYPIVSKPFDEDVGKPQGWISSDIMAGYISFLFENGLIDQPVRPEDYIDMRYLPGTAE
jgi:ABC-type nitrate/sulfonate/bicarbonate transport system substrate-binding protein